MKTILEEASEIVDGARQSAYGHPRDNHGATAEFWTTYLKRRGLLAEDAVLDAHDVCDLNVLQKVSRDAHSRTRDTLVDIAGFARNAEMVDEPEAFEMVETPVRFRRVVDASERKLLSEVYPGTPKGFPLKWQDEADDIWRAIHKVQMASYHAPEHLFLPKRDARETTGFTTILGGFTTIFGIPIEIDESLDNDEFVLRTYLQSSRVIEYRHFRFAEVK